MCGNICRFSFQIADTCARDRERWLFIHKLGLWREMYNRIQASKRGLNWRMGLRKRFNRREGSPILRKFR